jgi:hypothetical protein
MGNIIVWSGTADVRMRKRLVCGWTRINTDKKIGENPCNPWTI